MLKHFLTSVTPESSISHEISIAFLRFFSGIALAVLHGVKKVPPSEKFMESVGNLGFPLPEFFAWSAGLSEFLGGLLLAVGLFTRPAAAMIIITMLVAAFVAHAADPFAKRELSLIYFAIAAVFLARGASKYSLDALLFNRKKSR